MDVVLYFWFFQCEIELTSNNTKNDAGFPIVYYFILFGDNFDIDLAEYMTKKAFDSLQRHV